MANFFVGEEGKEGGGQMQFYKENDPISPMITVKPCIGYAIHYLNPAGGWSTYCIPEPREKKQFNRTCSVFRKFKKDIKNITSRSWECQSGALEKRNADKFWMLLESTELYLETPDQELIPVRVTTSDWQQYNPRVDKRGPMATYSFELAECRDVVHYSNNM